MSGYGVAADPTENLFFSTGNSGPGTYDGGSAIFKESVAKGRPDITRQSSQAYSRHLTKTLDQNDGDLSSGGARRASPARSVSRILAVAAGKEGTMYLLNRDSLGGFTSGEPPTKFSTKKRYSLAGAGWS